MYFQKMLHVFGKRLTYAYACALGCVWPKTCKTLQKLSEISIVKLKNGAEFDVCFECEHEELSVGNKEMFFVCFHGRFDPTSEQSVCFLCVSSMSHGCAVKRDDNRDYIHLFHNKSTHDFNTSLYLIDTSMPLLQVINSRRKILDLNFKKKLTACDTKFPIRKFYFVGKVPYFFISFRKIKGHNK